MSKFSKSEENYIKAIYHLQQADTRVSTNDVAAALQTTAASVSDMLKKLKNKKLLTHKAYHGCRLTHTGDALALTIIRRHRLWEYFLHEKLGFSWDEVHEVAEELEHVGSEKLINRLDNFLGNPRRDPHGDPIPDTSGNMEQATDTALVYWKTGSHCAVAQIGDQSPEVLEMLKQKKIEIGTQLEIKQRFEYDQSVEVKINNRHLTQLSQQLAQNIFVKDYEQASF